MFINKWKPVYQLPDDTGADAPQIDTPEVDTPAEPDAGAGSGRSSIRKSLEKGFEDSRKTEAERDKKGKFTKQPKTAKRVAGGAELEPADDAEPAEVEAAEGEPAEPAADAAPQTAAPEAFSKEAKAEWAKVPAAVQAAILKRETDTAKGVEELKGKYKDLDSALAPHMNEIRKNGHSPAQAVSQLFAWMQALAGNPDVAFPALAKSFGYDLAKFAPQAAPAAAAAAAPADPAAQPTGAVPPELQKYINDLQQKVESLEKNFGTQLGEVKSTFQRENEEKTNAVLMNWAKDKPHFDAVRGMMAQFIQSGAVPLKEGQVDLDGAYDMAVFAHPEVRAKVLAEQEAKKVADAKKKAAEVAAKKQADADKARKAGVSVGTGAPGDTPAPAKKSGKGKSVRDSIMEAREQLSE
jgi:hypothetical protein